MLIMCLAGLFLCIGCNESQVVQDRPVWAKGELPDDWVEYFGDDNGARMDYAQSQVINSQTALIHGSTVKDANGLSVHKAGLIVRLTALEGLIARIEKLEEPAIQGSFLPLAIEGDE